MNETGFNNLVIGKTSSGKTNIPPIYFFLIRIRSEKKESLLNMADKLGIEVSELTKIEQGYSPIPKGFFSKLYAIYQIPIEFGTLELWDTIEQHLYDLRLKLEWLDSKGVSALTVLQLIIRYESGERSSDLHSQFWENLVTESTNPKIGFIANKCEVHNERFSLKEKDSSEEGQKNDY